MTWHNAETRDEEVAGGAVEREGEMARAVAPVTAERGTSQKNKPIATVEVSDHAVLRYLERVGGVDIEGIRERLVPEHVKEQIKTVGAGKFPVNGSYVLVVNGPNNAVVTVLAQE